MIRFNQFRAADWLCRCVYLPAAAQVSNQSRVQVKVCYSAVRYDTASIALDWIKSAVRANRTLCRFLFSLNSTYICCKFAAQQAVGQLKTRVLTSRDHQKCKVSGWNRQIWQCATRLKGRMDCAKLVWVSRQILTKVFLRSTLLKVFCLPAAYIWLFHFHFN